MIFRSVHNITCLALATLVMADESSYRILKAALSSLDGQNFNQLLTNYGSYAVH